jgi:hypothetical protein
MTEYGRRPDPVFRPSANRIGVWCVLAVDNDQEEES